ncbi:DUF6882 domain-containing protein [Flagellimonas pacifica]|uniref:Uncharacterized protein n=1 Tax=Flagellimonas pacifica TaxID=1247520 RepID=A0A285MXN7_9FLAO|nr:DUF6882 domain-containing protein [Allomuricauda parva]SNZ01848.1 hypothetical protein SAMN06265377_3697 [Allomuricauda parva]
MKTFIYLGGLFFLNLITINQSVIPYQYSISILDCEAFYKTAMDEMVADQNSFMEKYLKGDEGDYARHYDFKNSVLKISNKKNGIVVLEIDFIHVGHFDAEKSVWHWSWEDADIDPKHAENYKKVKQYGIENACDKLTVKQWLGKELNAWEMSGAVNHILNGKGAARHYTHSEYNYVVFMDIRPRVD